MDWEKVNRYVSRNEPEITPKFGFYDRGLNARLEKVKYEVWRQKYELDRKDN